MQPPSLSLLPPYNAWVVYCDVYGLNLVIREEGEEGALRRIQAAHQDIRELLLGSSINYSSLHLQDSLFLVFPDEPDDIDDRDDRALASERLQQKWQGLVGRVLAISAEHGLILRGGAAYGLVVTDPSTVLGQPVYRAIEYERLVGAPIVLLPAKEYHRMFSQQVDVTDLERLDGFAPPFQPVATRNGGEILGVPILPAPRDSFTLTVKRRLRQSRFEGHAPSLAFWKEADRLIARALFLELEKAPDDDSEGS